MAQRKTTFRVDSSPVQGEDSWVELGYMTWGEIQSAMKGDFKTDDILEKYVIDWNWVDENGDKLPVSVDGLFEPERRFLLDYLFDPNKDGSKN